MSSSSTPSTPPTSSTPPSPEPTEQPTEQPTEPYRTDQPGPQVDSPQTPERPRSRYSMGTLPNMLRSMLVIGLFVLALVAIVPRTSQVPRSPVDAAAKASQVAAQTTWALQLPKGLGEGWVPTVATFAPGTDKVPTFTTVWSTPSGADIALKQAAGATSGWVTRSVADGEQSGTVQVSGRTFERFVADDAGQLGYLVRGEGPTGVTLVASGTAPEDELKAFVAALAPVNPSLPSTPSTSTRAPAGG